MCRDEFEEISEFVEYYREALGSADLEERFEALMHRISSGPACACNPACAPEPAGSFEPVSTCDPVSIHTPGHKPGDPEGIELVHEPYSLPFDETPCWAAATEQQQSYPLRFCSKDGRYILREFPMPGEGAPRYFLVGDKGIKTVGIDIEIDGLRLTTGENGRLDFFPAGFTLSGDSRIIIRANIPD